MSDTPRTDALIDGRISDAREFGSANETLFALLDHARQLERELAAARKELDHKAKGKP